MSEPDPQRRRITRADYARSALATFVIEAVIVAVALAAALLVATIVLAVL